MRQLPIRLISLFLLISSGTGLFETCATAQTANDSRPAADRYHDSIFTVNAYVESPETGANTPRRVSRNVGTAISFGSGEYLVTLQSVIKDADRITVTSSSGAICPAALVDTDAENRISVLKVQNSPIATLPDIVLDNPVRAGMAISLVCINGDDLAAVDGTVETVRQDGTFFIRSHAEQPTSGTPVFDTEAGLAGLLAYQIENGPSPQATADQKPTRTYLVIPAEYIWLVAQSIVNQDRQCGWLGVSSDIEGDTRSEGVLVRNVIVDSPAERSGIKTNDRIVQFNDQPVGTFRRLIEQLSSTRPGETAHITVMRKSERVKIPVPLAAYPPRAR